MTTADLLAKARNTYSQNGEDGVINTIFSIIGTTNKFCCEFGAWDGLHLSNTRLLIEKGWGALLIESDKERHDQLVKNFARNKKVKSLNVLVDDEGNSLSNLFKRTQSPKNFDFISIDIDGLDYYVLKSMDVSPRLICIEVNAGHSPLATKLLPKNVAKNNVGQPLGAFTELMAKMNYRLLAYTGNAFFLRNDVGFDDKLQTASPDEAYRAFLNQLPYYGKEWLYLVNKGWVTPHYLYRNNFLSAGKLGIKPSRVIKMRVDHHKGRLK